MLLRVLLHAHVRRAAGSFRTNTRPRSEHDLPRGCMLIQTCGLGSSIQQDVGRVVVSNSRPAMIPVTARYPSPTVRTWLQGHPPTSHSPPHTLAENESRGNSYISSIGSVNSVSGCIVHRCNSNSSSSIVHQCTKRRRHYRAEPQSIHAGQQTRWMTRQA